MDICGQHTVAEPYDPDNSIGVRIPSSYVKGSR